MDERLDERLGEGRKGLDDPDPDADVEDLLEDPDEVVAAAERGPEAEQHDFDADEDAEQAVGATLDARRSPRKRSPTKF